jgi:hypothetical protein
LREELFAAVEATERYLRRPLVWSALVRHARAGGDRVPELAEAVGSLASHCNDVATIV